MFAVAVGASENKTQHNTERGRALGVNFAPVFIGLSVRLALGHLRMASDGRYLQAAVKDG